MDLLALFILASLIGTLIIARVIVWSTDRASNSAITNYFKASEYILETGEPPPEWLAVPFRVRLFRTASASISHDQLMARLDDLFRYFEQCSFFEDEWTREQLLSQLGEVRENWQTRA